MKSFHLMAIWFALVMMGFTACKEDAPADSPVQNNTNQEDTQTEWDSSYRPLLHKFSSTGCTPCARFGLPLFDRVAHIMGDSILPLITHFKYNDPFITESSRAIEEALLNHYSSPQIWVNQNELTLDLIRTGLPSAVNQCADFLRKERVQENQAHLALKLKANSSGRFDLHFGVRNATDQQKTWHFEIYGHEDSIWASQSGIWPPPHHFHVNRGGYFGGMGKRIVLEPGAQREQTIEYIPCASCIPKQMYFILIIWEEYSPGRYRYVNGKMSKKG